MERPPLRDDDRADPPGPRTLDRLAESLTPIFAMTGVMTAIGVLTTAICAFAGRVRPATASLTCLAGAAISVLAWLGYCHAERRARAWRARRPKSIECAVTLGGRSGWEALFRYSVQHATVGPAGLRFVRLPPTILPGVFYVAGQFVIQFGMSGDSPRLSVLAWAVAALALAAWAQFPRTVPVPWEAVELVVARGGTAVLLLDSPRLPRALDLEGTPALVERFLLASEPMVPIVRLPAAPGPVRVLRPLPARKPYPEPRPTLDARKAKELDEALERLTRM